VVDKAPPTIKIQQTGITVEATVLQVKVNLGVVTANDLVDGAVPISNNAPTTFPLGITTVTYTATDAAGNVSTAMQNVVVQDTTAPVITPPAPVVADSTTGQAMAVSIATATATDVFTPVSITNNAPAIFPIGNATVIWTATDANNNSATARQLVTVNDTSIFANLPPDPGAAGKLTLAGIDSDNDGVRDDIQRWIVMTYPNSKKTRRALTQKAKTMQQFLLDAVDPIKSLSAAVQMGKDRSCLSYILGERFYRVSKGLKATTLDTYLRSKTWLQADKHLSGTMFKALPYNQRKQGCNFNPDVMSN